MKIKEIETYLLSDTLDERFYFSQFDYASRLICVVKVTTESGLVGWGEGYGPANIIKAGIDFLKPLVIGKSPLDSDLIWNDMFRRSIDYARKGILMSAISALDVAIWDLKGKILKQPISTLLGGRFREKVQVYATGLYFTDAMEGDANMERLLSQEALEYKEAGYSAVKMKVGLGIEKDVKNVAAIRKAIGNDMKLGVDSNHAYNVREAIELSQKIEQYDIMWFEEPITPDDYAGFKELRSRVNIPIAAGECEFRCDGFKTLLENRCVDFIQPETGTTGGITEAKRISTIANTYHVEMTPHNWGTGIIISANLHITANLQYSPGRIFDKQPLLEFDRSPNRIREELITKPFAAKDGYIDVPTGYGLGIEVDEDKLNYFALN
ncbi:MAG: mandelate racemase/muconate lactonizing enzyme family protein [Rikenellaceae bacterium]